MLSSHSNIPGSLPLWEDNDNVRGDQWNDEVCPCHFLFMFGPSRETHDSCLRPCLFQIWDSRWISFKVVFGEFTIDHTYTQWCVSSCLFFFLPQNHNKNLMKFWHVHDAPSSPVRCQFRPIGEKLPRPITLLSSPLSLSYLCACAINVIYPNRPRNSRLTHSNAPSGNGCCWKRQDLLLQLDMDGFHWTPDGNF